MNHPPLDNYRFHSTTGKNQTSKFRGVCWNKKQSKWKVTVLVKGKTLFTASFDDEIEAAKSYNKNAMRLNPRNCILNTIPKT